MSESVNYEDVSFIDSASEDELLQTAVDRMAQTIPEWEPDESQTEMVLLQAMALMVGMEVWAINQLPETVLEQLLNLYGVTRSEGVQASTVVEFGVDESAPTQTVPEGTVLRFTIESTGETYDLETTESVTITTSESLTGTAAAVMVEPGAATNGLEDVQLDVVDPLYFVEYARMVSPLTGGADEETDESLYERGSARLQRQVATLVLPNQFELAMVEDERVGRATALNLTDPDVQGQALGHITVVGTDRSGNALSEPVADELQRRLTDMALAGLTVHVVPPVYTNIDIVVNIVQNRPFNADLVKKNVEAELRTYFSPLKWPWRTTIYATEVTSTAAKAPGVALVTSSTIAVEGGTPSNESADLTSTGLAALPVVSSVTVNITGEV